jgi:hypothetical protein
MEVLKQKVTNVKNKIMDTDSSTECMREDGIYVNDTCHYYEVLKRLCLQIGFEKDDKGVI